MLISLLTALLVAHPRLDASATPRGAAPATTWAWPLTGTPVVDRPFEPPRTTYGAGHRGVDLRAPAGASVRAAGAGRVTYVGLLAGRGVVTVTHLGGLRTTYEPVAASVELGEAVSIGAHLGTMTTGHASCRLRTTCLHWGLLRGTTYLDPLSLLGQTRIRLLPLGPGSVVRRAVPGSPLARSALTGRPPETSRRHASARSPSRPTGSGSSVLVAAGSTVAAAVGTGLVLGRRRRTGDSARAPRAPGGRFGP